MEKFLEIASTIYDKSIHIGLSCSTFLQSTLKPQGDSAPAVGEMKPRHSNGMLTGRIFPKNLMNIIAWLKKQIVTTTWALMIIDLWYCIANSSM